MEHLIELRTRLFRAVIGILVGTVASFFFSKEIINFLEQPYCQAQMSVGKMCQPLQQLQVTDYLVTQLKFGLYVGLIISAPIWLYQLWSFITPGLHKHERRWAYSFVAVATPLFVAGAVLAYFVIARGLEFLLAFGGGTGVVANLELKGYMDFITGMMVLFGCGFEFPLIVVMLNFAGLVSARRLLSWWRVSVFLMFLFAAIVTPTPDPFGMTALAIPMVSLYFLAVGVAFVHDRRKARRSSAMYGNVSDDEASVIETSVEEIEAPSGNSTDTAQRRQYDDDAT
ncbi:twin-arginine translocase subunit TatC [Fodinicola acaciae]|uniref:twin-arginine translocase subunit TatC n=1 Tax=Fodinicola acaciae TaxID=2681555 RepID=UPI0013D769C7|nr:twin-arginine translocase subunit TatC [Fodinicola acaciae]